MLRVICARVCASCGPGSWPSWGAAEQQQRRLHAQPRFRCRRAAQLLWSALLLAARHLKHCCSGTCTAALASCCLLATLVGSSCGWTRCSHRYITTLSARVGVRAMVSLLRQHSSSNFCVAMQIANIAEHGEDRAARVAACELLHATTLWMVGESALHLSFACLSLSNWEASAIYNAWCFCRLRVTVYMHYERQAPMRNQLHPSTRRSLTARQCHSTSSCSASSQSSCALLPARLVCQQNQYCHCSVQLARHCFMDGMC